MGLRGQRTVTVSSGQAVRFLVTLIGTSSVAVPAHWVRGIVMPAEAGRDGLVTWAHVPYDRTDLAARLKIVSNSPTAESRLILYGNEEKSRSFAVDKVLGLIDVERAVIHPLPPQFRGGERDRLLGFFVDQSYVALIANPFWVLELPLRKQALDIFALRFSEHRPGEFDPRLYLSAAALEEPVSLPMGHVN